MKDGISITIEDKLVQEMLGKMYARGMNLSPVLKRISQMLRSFALENFRQQGRPKWKGLSESTLAQRTQKNPQILQDKGLLKQTLTPFNTDVAAGIGSVLKYARIHQLGGWAGRGKKVKIKARDYLSPAENDMEMAAATIKSYLLKG